MECFKKLFKRTLREPQREKLSVKLPKDYRRPRILDVDIEVKTHGKYKTKSGKPRGAVVHFTSGNYGEPQDALNTLSSMVDRGLGALVLDRDGTFYRAKNHDQNKVTYHAGISRWKDVESLSFYCVGIEVVSAGKLDKDGRSWFGTTIPIEDRRYVPQRDNIEAGVYHTFTAAQELSLRNFMLWQRLLNQDFMFSWVVGHDEIARPKGRRNDPGGSLSSSMPEFRAHLFRHSYNE